jgi:hypothetical protein
VVESFKGKAENLNLMLVAQQYVRLSKAGLKTYETKAMENE